MVSTETRRAIMYQFFLISLGVSERGQKGISSRAFLDTVRKKVACVASADHLPPPLRSLYESLTEPRKRTLSGN